jgi:ABC-type lipoprotein export system ATPase subunit
VLVGETSVHTLSENQMARWRGRNLGIVFQFFQLLPNLSVVENVMMPMDLCNTYPIWERRKRALNLLELVEMREQAEKLPSALSGGQQQRVAIARALANDPPLVIADEPTGNLDSKTADAMFQLFEKLAAEGKTVVMVTHDSSLARRVSRTVLIVDGEVVNEYVARALPALTPPLLLEATHRIQPQTFQPGATIIKENEPGRNFYILSKGNAEVVLKHPNGGDVVADRLQPGQYFGEVSLLHSSRTIAAVRAAPETPVEVLALDAKSFQDLIDASPDFHSAVHTVADERMAHTQSVQEGV